MDKVYYAIPKNYGLKEHLTYESAEETAKRMVAKKYDGYSGNVVECYIVEAVALAKQPVPDVEVVKLTTAS